ncbi:D-methionine transport system substrate-binding protein [Corynebacterium otitidis]
MAIHRLTKRVLAGGAAVALAATSLVACNDDSEEVAEGPIRVGATDDSSRQWEVFKEEVENAGIDMEVVSFSDYNTPNDALVQGQIDVNQFQHLQFLATYNVGADEDLVPVGSTEIVPLSLYWKDHDSLEGIEGEDITIPNDSTNQARAINVLIQAELIELENDDVLEPVPADIDEEASKVGVIPVDAAQTAIAYGEGNPAVINNSFLNRANIDPNEAIFSDDPESELAEPYINTFVTTPENADDPRIPELVEIWHSQPVQDAIAEDSGGTSVPVQRPVEELQEILERIEEQLRNEEAAGSGAEDDADDADAEDEADEDGDAEDDPESEETDGDEDATTEDEENEEEAEEQPAA